MPPHARLSNVACWETNAQQHTQISHTQPKASYVSTEVQKSFENRPSPYLRAALSLPTSAQACRRRGSASPASHKDALRTLNQLKHGCAGPQTETSNAKSTYPPALSPLSVPDVKGFSSNGTDGGGSEVSVLRRSGEWREGCSEVDPGGLFLESSGLCGSASWYSFFRELAGLGVYSAALFNVNSLRNPDFDILVHQRPAAATTTATAAAAAAGTATDRLLRSR